MLSRHILELGAFALLGVSFADAADFIPCFSTRRVGGLRFVKIGKLSMSFCVCKSAAPIGTK
jgi:hypothetical protein